MRERLDLVITCPRSELTLPVWDNWVRSVIISHEIPKLIQVLILSKVNTMNSMHGPQKFSGQFKGNLENMLVAVEMYVYDHYHVSYTKLRVIRERDYLKICPPQDTPFDIWDSSTLRK